MEFLLKNDHLESYKSALSCDPVSAFGGIVSCNFKVTKNLALELNKLFLEVIIANGFDNSAIKIVNLLKLINTKKANPHKPRE